MREELGFEGEVADAIIKLQDSSRRIGDGQAVAEIAEIKRCEIDFLLEECLRERVRLNRREIMCAHALDAYCDKALDAFGLFKCICGLRETLERRGKDLQKALEAGGRRKGDNVQYALSRHGSCSRDDGGHGLADDGI